MQIYICIYRMHIFLHCRKRPINIKHKQKTLGTCYKIRFKIPINWKLGLNIMKTINLLLLLLTVVLTASAQFQQPDLPYEYNALEPYIDTETMNIHYNNHHASYVNNLNVALSNYPELQTKSLEELLLNLDNLPKQIQTAVRNNGGGHYNHSLFWSLLTPAPLSVMSPKVEKILVDNFGSIENFKTEFEKAAAGRFGSGWVWLIQDRSGRLRIVSTPNQDNPAMSVTEVKGKPILALDVWEHAYYLKYRSKRGDYVKNFWNVVNWTAVEKLLNK